MRAPIGFLARVAQKLRPCRMVEAALLLLLLVAIVATHAGAALTWDGAPLLFAFLDVQDLSLPHDRRSLAVFQLPVLLLSRHTSNMQLLAGAYGLSHAVVPFLSAYASWLIVRNKRPRLIVWPLLWICLGALAGQMFFVTESLMAVHAVWPLLLLLATGLTWLRAIFCGGLAAFLFWLHPISGALLLLAAVTGSAMAFRSSAGRTPLLVVDALLFAAGIARGLKSLNDPYELSQARVNLTAIFSSLKLPWLGVWAACVAFVALVIAHALPASWNRWLSAVVIAALVLVGAALMPWALNPSLWQDALNYRFIVPFVAAPFLIAACVYAVLDTRLASGLTRSDGYIVVVAGLLFALVLITQCLVWLGLRRSLEATLARSRRPCVSMEAIPACRNSALKWWSTPSYALVIQGHSPRTLLLPGTDCTRRDLDRIVPVNPWYQRPRQVGWFDLRWAGLPRRD